MGFRGGRNRIGWVPPRIFSSITPRDWGQRTIRRYKEEGTSSTEDGKTPERSSKVAVLWVVIFAFGQIFDSHRSASALYLDRGFYSNGYGAPVPEVLTVPVAYHAVILRHSFRGPCGVISGANSGDLVENVTSGTNLGDLDEEPMSGTNPEDFVEELISGTNPGDLVERVISGTNLGDLVEEPISGMNPEDFAGVQILGIWPRR
ncbi:hypothetical protein BHE74_00016427 [Ensete ventricosum]|nr:hypothetical protein BHE74_00016427 [Ensete ventricosum]